MTRRHPKWTLVAAALFALAVVFVPVAANAQGASTTTAGTSEFCRTNPNICTAAYCAANPILCAAEAVAAPDKAGGLTISGLLGIGDVAGAAVGWVTFVIGFIIAFVAGVAITFISYFIQIFLQISTFIPHSIAVTEGFKVFLSVANLTFVFGIIVIALATIVRYQTYGIKQLLWKLIVMAVAVNFSMTLVSTIMSFSDGLTLYLLNNMMQAEGGQGAGIAEGNFATALAGAFQPQSLLMENGQVSSKFGVDPASLSKVASNFSTTLSGLVNIVFVVLVLISIVITLGTLLVMLAIRYVTLTLMLVVMPLAWTGWVFPAMHGWWTEWWRKFLQQVFFPPAVVFFLYLTIRTSEGMRDANLVGRGKLEEFIFKKKNTTTVAGGILAGAQTIIGSFVGTFAGTLFQAIAIVGLSFGGLWAAKKLNIEFAGKAMSAAQNASKAFGGYVGRRAGGRIARGAASERPSPLKPGWRGQLQRLNPMRGVDRITRGLVQSDLAKSYGITKAVEKYGDKTNLGKTSDIRLAAKEKFRQAATATDPVVRDQLKKEAGALVNLAAQRRADAPGIFGSVFGTAGKDLGLWKPEKGKRVAGPDIETLKNLGTTEAEEEYEVQEGEKEEEYEVQEGEKEVSTGVVDPATNKPITKTIPNMVKKKRKVPNIIKKKRKVRRDIPGTLTPEAQRGVEAAKEYATRAKGGVVLTKEQAEQIGLTIEGGSGEGGGAESKNNEAAPTAEKK